MPLLLSNNILVSIVSQNICHLDIVDVNRLKTGYLIAIDRFFKSQISIKNDQ